MARMHTRKRGKSKSRKVKKSTAHLWLQYSPEQIREFVLKLAKEGRAEAEIGLTLRDQFGIPSVKNATGKRISEILKEGNLLSQYPSDLLDLIKKAVRLRRHLQHSKKDLHNKLRLTRTESKIKRLVRYYRGYRLPANWKYDPQQAALIVK